MEKMIRLMVIGAAAVSMTACASKKTAEMESRLAQEPALTTPNQVAAAAQDELMTIPDLTTEQRTKLQQIQAHARIEGARLRAEIGQAKSLLFKTIANPNAKRSEVNWAKNKIVKLERERVDLMLGSVDQVEKVLGRRTPSQQALERYFDEDVQRTSAPYDIR